MNCNGTGLHLLVGIYLMCMLLRRGVAVDVTHSADGESDSEMGYNGNLYDVFKKRLDEVFKELYNNVSDSGNDVKVPDIPEGTRKRAAVSNCLYEEFKRRLDKFNNEFIQESGKAFKRRSGEANESTGEKRSTVRECLYEEYKKRLDKIGNDLSLDGEKVFDRSGRDILVALGVPRAKTQAEKDRPRSTPEATGAGDIVVKRNFYEDYKKRLDQLTRELYQKDSDRLQRNSAQGGGTRTPESKRSNQNTNEGAQNIRKTNLFKREQKKAPLPAAESKRSTIDPSSAFRYGGDTLSYGIDVGASYPAVLTKALESSMAPLNASPKGLLSSLAQKMNMSSLELAKQLAGMSHPYDTELKTDPKMAENLRKFIETTVHAKGFKEQEAPPAIPSTAPAAVAAAAPPLGPSLTVPVAPLVAPSGTQQEAPHREENSALYDKLRNGEQALHACDTGSSASDSAASAHISFVLEKVLSKLERLQQDRSQDKGSAAENCLPEDAPCTVVGSWSAYVAGLRFEITPGKSAERNLGLAEKNNKLLSIEAADSVPPKEHRIVEPSWKFMGSAMKELGGPFFMYTESRLDDMAVTFLGYCRTCGGIDTIYGSWSVLRPSKDCQDISTTLENHRDIFRRYNMDAKRKQRYKDILYERSKYAKANSD